MSPFRTFSGSPPSAPNAHVPAAEQLLLDIMDTVREPLIVVDAAFHVTQANRAFFRSFLVEPADTLGRSLFALGDGQWDIPALRELLRDKLAVAPAVNDFDVDHVFPSIGRRIMRLNARVVHQDETMPRVILIAIEDVTVRRITEWRLLEQRVELERSNAALNEFASVASHDLQEPLRKILSFGERLELAAGPALDAASTEHLSRMMGAALRMRTLINDLLLYSQVSTHIQAFAPTDLSGVARDVLADLETAVADAGARVEVGALPVIDADALQMRQLFQNLLANAIKYRRPDVPSQVRLSAERTDAQHCIITVADNGIGFHQDHADRIFRMFERLHGRGQYDGSGIGLAICRKIVERHRGTIAAASSAGQGATFTVTLPVTQHVSGLMS
ncbi:MAG: ATP-binding protein [Gemmatimonadaceae bacterium]|nr:ATP-binding protein [Gemmatimonadaceae bacterium]